MLLKDTTYDLLKHIAINVIPALGTFVGVVGVAVGWQPTAIAETIIFAVGSFIASCIGMSKKAYEKAKLEQFEGEDE